VIFLLWTVPIAMMLVLYLPGAWNHSPLFGTCVKLKDRKRPLSWKNDHNALWH